VASFRSLMNAPDPPAGRLGPHVGFAALNLYCCITLVEGRGR